MKSNHNSEQPASTRGPTVVIIAFLMGGALLLNWAMRTTTADHDKLKSALAQEIVARHCVVADVDMRVPSLYKCDLPTPNTYVRAADLNAEALATYAGK